MIKKLRYIVPFKIDTGNFDEICQKVNDHRDNSHIEFLEDDLKCQYVGKWEEKRLENIDSDVYDNVQSSFIDKQEGNTWKFNLYKVKNNNIKENLITFSYLKNNNEYFDVSLSNLNMIICRTGIGFLYYDVSIPKSILLDELILFQNEFKEINTRSNNQPKFWRKISVQYTRDMLKNPLNDRKPKISNWKEVKDIITVPFSVGSWLACRLRFLGIEFFAYRENHYLSDLDRYFDYSKVASNTNKEDFAKYTDIPITAPDKAMLFTMMTLHFDDTDDVQHKAEQYVYYLTNGYTYRYMIPENIADDMVKPFGNVYLYATHQGAGYYAVVDELNEKIFENIIKRNDDYFTLYLDVLYQSFSVLNFSQEISSSKLPQDYNAYIIDSEKSDLREMLLSIRARISLFLVKSMTASVSCINHHNIFYHYLQKQLNIDKDVHDLTIGLDALDDLYRQQQVYVENMKDREEEKHRKDQEEAERKSDREMQITLSGIAFLATWSALSDSMGFVDGIIDRAGFIIENMEQNDGISILTVVLIFGWLFIGLHIVKIAKGFYGKLWKQFEDNTKER